MQTHHRARVIVNGKETRRTLLGILEAQQLINNGKRDRGNRDNRCRDIVEVLEDHLTYVWNLQRYSALKRKLSKNNFYKQKVKLKDKSPVGV